MNQGPLVEIAGVSKSFRAIRALANVSLDVARGEIHALVGENGAGKSTLMKILAGVHRADAGTIRVDGQPVDIRSPRDARQLGIAIVYQELAPIPDLSVAENVFVRELGGRLGFIDRRDLNQRARALLASLGVAIDPRARVASLSVAHQQIVEICRELSGNARVIVLDEPTSVLAPREADQLFDALLRLRARGVGIVYISHRLDEVFRIADRITVLKDGAKVGTVLPREVTQDDLIGMMIGRRLTTMFPARDCPVGDEVLRVEGLRRGRAVNGVSFAVRAGEVLGVAGLVGAGRSEIARTVFGADRPTGGTVAVGHQRLRARSPRDAVKAGVALVPEDRKREGLVLDMAIRKNLSMPNLRLVASGPGVLRAGRERRFARDLTAKFRIKARDVDQAAADLSGGNQQKVVLAKWLATRCRVLLLDEPTRGVDVGAKVEIYELINELAAAGLAIVLISSEMLEIIGMCDRVLVVREGRIAGTLDKGEMTEANIMRLAVGAGAAAPGGPPTAAALGVGA